VRLEDKRVINGAADVNQLVPFKYRWAWRKVSCRLPITGCRKRFNMQRDIELWKNPNA
jgi:ribonucleoside-diphosphate reductase beta chain